MWQGLDIPVHKNTIAFFNTAVQSHLGQGDHILFWNDKWLFGSSIGDLALGVVVAVPQIIQKQRTVDEGVKDIQGGQYMIGLYEFFHLWDALLYETWS